MPVKKTKKPRARRAPAKKKGLKQKQKQKQRQVVNVQVSSGGSGGGGTQFIPMPSAPAFDYAQLAQLIRPANTVDVPIRAQANPEPIAAREAAAPSLAGEMGRSSGGFQVPMGSQTVFQGEKAPSADAPISGQQKAGKTRKPRGPNKPKPIAYVVQGGYESESPRYGSEYGSEYERMVEAQKSGSFM